MRRCVAVATPTLTAASALRKLGFKDQIRVISNGIDTGQFTPGESSESLAIQLGIDRQLVVLYTGRLDAEKSMDMWLESAALIPKEIDVRFLVGGEGTDRTRLQALASTLGLNERVSFIGYLPSEDLPNLYRIADIYLITSSVELQSITTLEALASGLPIVAVNAGALPELVHDRVNGYVVASGDARGAADCILSLLLDAETRKSMGHQSRRLAERHALPQTIKLYQALLMQSAGPPGKVYLEHASAAGN